MINKRKINYLLVGFANTVIGYVIGVATYRFLDSTLGIIWVGIISSILSITVSFATYKIFVFKTKGMWLEEYIKAFLVYGSTAIIGVGLLWGLVDIMNISIWIAQAITMGITFIVSYMGHAKFTFKR